VGESFAEIFFGNCTALGLPCANAAEADAQALGEAILANPKLEVTVDLVDQKVTYGDKWFPVTMLEGPRTADPAVATGLQPSPAAQLAGLPDPGRVRGPLCYFRSGYALTPAAQRRLPNPTFIRPGTENQRWSVGLAEPFISVVRPRPSVAVGILFNSFLSFLRIANPPKVIERKWIGVRG